MFSNDEARHLLKLPKVIEGNTELDLSNVRSRIDLTCPDAPEYKFMAEVTTNKRIDFKVSFHHQEHSTYTGLLRIDYKGRHTNPEEHIESLPEVLTPYIGKVFDIEEPHIHVYVAGYKPLSWALPLEVYKFSVLNINSQKDMMDAIYAFAKEINIISKFSVQDSII